jgi:mannose-6-phosphate isomerase-like protein (cupin superfamily)
MPFVASSELPSGEPRPGWMGRFFSSDSMTVAYYEVAGDAVPLHEHCHPQEEIWNVVDGEMAITIAGVERVVGAGGAAIVPSNAPHSARALGPCRAVVVDHPARDAIGGIRPTRPQA